MTGDGEDATQGRVGVSGCVVCMAVTTDDIVDDNVHWLNDSTTAPRVVEQLNSQARPHPQLTIIAYSVSKCLDLS